MLLPAASAPAQQAADPPDPVGAPGRYTILRGDDLFIARQGNGAASVSWLEADGALGVAAQSPFAAAGALPREVLFPQARGRFRDPLSDRVLALRQIQGAGGLQFELAAQTPLVEPGWSGAGEPGGPIPPVSFAVPNPEANAPSALATGDLDNLADASGNLHDEAVIAFKDAADGLEVRVVDYNATPGQATVTGPRDALPGVGGPDATGSLAAGIGDFDADGRNEIAIAWQRVKPSGGAQDTELHLSILRYTRNPTPTVTALAPAVSLPDGAALGGSDNWPSYELAVADLDGQPGDEIAVSQIGANGTVSGASITMIGLNSRWAVAHAGQGVVQGLTNVPGGGSPEWRPRLAAGLFHLDPDSGFTLRRRQLAIQWLSRDVIPVMQVFDVVRNPYECAQAGGVESPCDLELVALTPQVTVVPSRGTARMGFAAGGFAGTPATGEPTPWGIATASNAEQTVKLWKLTPAPGAAQPFALTQTATIPVGDPSLPFPTSPGALGANLTAYDRQGRSLVLGAPLRLTLQALPRPSLIFQDPPKHVDWLDGSFVNVSRTPEIKVEFTDTTNKQFSNKTTTTSDYTIGGSASDTVKVTAQEGLEGIEKAKDSVQVSAGIKYSHDENKDIYISYGSTYELAVSAATGDDDLVGGAYQTISVWRYPILGELLRRLDGSVVTDASGQPLHPFYELQLPGAVEQINPPMGGRGLDWYQPLHENGNALSYPQRISGDDGPVPIPDLGTFLLPGDTTPKKQALAKLGYALDTTTSSVDLKIGIAAGGGTSTTTTSTLSESLDVKNSTYVSVGGFIFPGATVENDLDLKFQSGQSWGSINTSKNSAESASGFTLARESGVKGSQAYNAATAYYSSDAGVMKVAHAVDLAGNAGGMQWWSEQSYPAPDPALNLPFRIDMTKNESTGVLDVPAWSDSPGHQRLRQFFVVHPADPSKPLVSEAPFNVAPVTGQEVEFQVRVYNYSLGSGTPDFMARFVAVPVDDRTGKPEGDPVEIGTEKVNALEARANRVVTTTWTARGPVDRDASQQWRIFVILDPDDQVKNETHEWKDRYKRPPKLDKKPIVDPFTGADEILESGQNNQGYGLLTVHAPDQTSPRALSGAPVRGRAAEAPRRRAARRGRDIHLRRGALTAGRPGARLRRRGARARVDRAVSVRLRVEARRRHRRHHGVLLYARAPGGRKRLVAAETVPGVSDRRGTHVWFTWVPRRTGRHRLWAKVLEQADDGRRGNARARLDVAVRPRVVERPRLRALARRVRERGLDAPAEPRLVRLAQAADGALRAGQVRRARRILRDFSAAALVGLGTTMLRRDAAELRYLSRTIRRDLRIERLPRLIRALGAPPALTGPAQRARAALRRGRPAAARRELLALARAAGRVRGARRVGALARGLAVQLR